MQTRSGKTLQIAVSDKTKTKYSSFLTNGMVRDIHDDTFHICVFCRQRFNLKAKYTVLQCPSCKNVCHESCMMAYIQKSSNDFFKCPCCRQSIPVEVKNGIIDTDELEIRWAFELPHAESDSEDFEDEEDECGGNSEESDDSDDASYMSDDASD